MAITNSVLSVATTTAVEIAGSRAERDHGLCDLEARLASKEGIADGHAQCARIADKVGDTAPGNPENQGQKHRLPQVARQPLDKHCAG